jgi:DNA-binding beta-propeller fold protein YncE
VYSWGGGDAIGMAHHIEIDPKGNVWLADVGLHVVMQFTPEGKLLQTLGTRGEAGLDDDHFNMPTDMAITPKGDVFIADGYGNSRVVHYDARGRFVKAWGRRGDGPGEFNEPHAIAIDSTERIYVADRSNGRVQVFDQSGKFLDQWPNVVVPWGLWITPNDEIWVCGSTPAAHRNPTGELGIPPRDQVFMRFDPSGRLLQMWAVPSGTNAHDKPGELNWVHGIALDSKGNIYAGDIMGQRAQKFIRQIGK